MRLREAIREAADYPVTTHSLDGKIQAVVIYIDEFQASSDNTMDQWYFVLISSGDKLIKCGKMDRDTMVVTLYEHGLSPDWDQWGPLEDG